MLAIGRYDKRSYQCILYIILGAVLSCYVCLSDEQESTIDPVDLVNYIASARETTPPTRMDLTWIIRSGNNGRTNNYAVEFDYEKRLFDNRNKDNTGALGIYDGNVVYIYEQDDNAIEFCSIMQRDPGLQLFDPRTLGGSPYLSWVHTPFGIFRALDDIAGWDTEYIGREVINGINTWHIRVTIRTIHGSGEGEEERVSIRNYWIGKDSVYGYRIYKCERNGVRIYSFYNNAEYHWLPDKIIHERSDGTVEQVHIKNANIVSDGYDHSYWSLSKKIFLQVQRYQTT